MARCSTLCLITSIRLVKSNVWEDFFNSKLLCCIFQRSFDFGFHHKSRIPPSIQNSFPPFIFCSFSFPYHRHQNLKFCHCHKMSDEINGLSVIQSCSGGDTTDARASPITEKKGEMERHHLELTPETQPQTLSKRALKRQARAQKFKQLKKKQKMENSATDGKDEAGYSKDEFNETSYYFENGLRKVYPYHFVFATHAKGRWVGRTLKDVLVKEFGFNHPSDVDKAFKEEKIQVNGHHISPTYIVKNCDFISHEIHRHENPVTDAQIEIIEDNEEVIVVNKPASIPCHPCGRYRYNSLVFILGKEMGYSNLRRKTTASTKRLEDQVLNREVQKEYVCRVVGEFPNETITVDQPLQALSNKLRLQIVSQSGKASQTTFERLSYNGRSSVVRCIPHTGRTHQIRVHLQYLGHPILNDVFYNSDAWGPNKGKGGVYNVSHETTCAQIYQTHQATQWEGGDNPLFYEKLREMTAQSEAQKCDAEVASVDKPSGTNVSPNQDLETGKQNQAPVNGGSDDNPPLRSSWPSQIVKTGNEAGGDNDNIISSSTCHTLEQETVRTESESVSSSSLMTKEIRDHRADHSDSNDRPKFDATRLEIDHSCDLCRKICVEPEQKHLIMFLHALKYKGPGWEYQTKLPDWAEENWQREDDFMIQ